MSSAGLPNLNRVMIAYNLIGEPDEDADDSAIMNMTETMKKTIKLRRIDGKT